MENTYKLPLTGVQIAEKLELLDGEASLAEINSVASRANTTANSAQATADTIKLAVEDETTGLAATKAIADNAAALAGGNASRLETAEGNITTLQGIVSTGADS